MCYIYQNGVKAQGLTRGEFDKPQIDNDMPWESGRPNAKGCGGDPAINRSYTMDCNCYFWNVTLQKSI